ncbi:MAG TPA: hypothetical protein VL737_02730, partial [Candidatus Pristimantibacillus sp.]|nr:hypothetical protein [Candidatus Pristimantibacillus sp.]
MGRSHSWFKKLPYIGIPVSIVAGLGILFAPHLTFAAGEIYTWVDNTHIAVTGGDLQGTSTLSTPAPTNNTLYGHFVYKTGCNIDMSLMVGFNNTGRLILPTYISNPGSPPPVQNPCKVDISNQYANQQITFSNTRPAPAPGPGGGGDQETQGQKSVTVTLYSPVSAANGPPKVDFTFKDSTGKVVATVSSDQQSVEPDVPADKRVIYYEASTKLEPGKYSVCFSALLGDCKDFTKVKYQGLNLTYGESLSQRNIDVEVDFIFGVLTGTPYTAGPFPVHLNTPGGTTTLNTVETDSYTDPGCPEHDFTPSALCQVAGETISDITTTLRATFEDVSPGQYQICLEDTDVCADVTKEAGLSTKVILKVDGQLALDMIFGNRVPQVKDDALCYDLDKGGISWYLCHFGQFFITGINKIDDLLSGRAGTSADSLLVNFLSLNTSKIFDTTKDSGKAFYTAWGVFRNIAYALLVIFGLIMVISQIMGLDILDAYTLRKMLPKLVIVAVVIPLLWPFLHI